MFPLLLLRSLLGIQLLMLVSVVLGTQAESNGTVSTIPTLSGCKTSCGDLTFSYPFGIGPDCSRGGDFELTCDESAQPPALLLHDGYRVSLQFEQIYLDQFSIYYPSKLWCSHIQHVVAFSWDFIYTWFYPDEYHWLRL
uniref:Wall-associated receptor kinase galacturonan-binding domain-containing protein n=1 Tax=Setaria viridis TaxID=4556 RepID=A0A4U6U1B9_SETVI|nr:hypothetical protein SEVIR_7G069300v2 [Setaria viridis]